jgi:Ca-activated chloride channel homolog
MNLLRGIAVLALSCAFLEKPAAAEIATDANIVTALDISDSIDARTIAIEIDGMAAAIRAPEILQAIRGGRHGQVGFAVFAWRDAAYPELVSWSLIATAADAAAVSARLESSFRVFLASDVPSPALDPHMTDLSGAIDHAAVLLLTAPFVADRDIVNVIGNGWDNVGEGPQRARNRLLAKGVTVNGVVLGYDPVLMDYYRGTVIGGPGSFLLSAAEPAAMAQVLARKFLYDIASSGGAHWPRLAATGRKRR